MDMELPLGAKARDKITGFTGILTSRSQMFSGTIQYAITPCCEPDKTDTLPSGSYFDLCSIEVLEEPTYPAIEPQTSNIGIGNEVTDIITGLKGIVVEAVVFINGCLYFHIVVTDKTKIKELEPKLFLSSSRLRYTGCDILPNISINTKNKSLSVQDAGHLESPLAATGGPSRPAHSIR